jgi:hypothetical protein
VMARGLIERVLGGKILMNCSNASRNGNTHANYFSPASSIC